MIRPPALVPGSRVALVAAAGPIPAGGVERAIGRVAELGWEPVEGRFCRGRCGYLSGTDDERAADLNQALRDPGIDAVWFLRGGYGTMRILDDLDWGALREHPKALIGYSDNTAVHLAARRAGVVAFHGPHPHQPEFPEFARDCLLQVVGSPEPAYELPFPEEGPQRARTLAGGVAEGPLVGGNLSLLSATMGTPFALQPEGAILFLEEVGEHPYRLDRLLSHLRLAGVLEAVAGIAVGGITETPGEDGDAEAARLMDEMLGSLGIPVAAGFPFGHFEASWTLPVGVRARLDAYEGTLALLEPAVS